MDLKKFLNMSQNEKEKFEKECSSIQFLTISPYEIGGECGFSFKPDGFYQMDEITNTVANNIIKELKEKSNSANNSNNINLPLHLLFWGDFSDLKKDFISSIILDNKDKIIAVYNCNTGNGKSSYVPLNFSLLLDELEKNEIEYYIDNSESAFRKKRTSDITITNLIISYVPKKELNEGSTIIILDKKNKKSWIKYPT